MSSSGTPAVEHGVSGTQHRADSPLHFYIGLTLALLSTFFIGTSFIFKKLALRRASQSGYRAGDGALNYLCEWMWWAGFILMGIGEGANFVAYTFAPAVLVTPLGGLSVLVSALLSSRFLNERLNFIGSLGCFICLLGSTLIVLHAPKEQSLNSLREMWLRCANPAFIGYCVYILIQSIILILYLGPRYGKTNPMVFTLISGSIGSLSVIACKGVGVGLKEIITVGIKPTISFWFFWFLLTWLLIAISIQMYYLNRALDLFNTGIITPILYVFFTGCVIIASAILFHELHTLKPIDYMGLIFGLILVVIGIFLMTVFREVNLNLDNLRSFVNHTSMENLCDPVKLGRSDFRLSKRNRYHRIKLGGLISGGFGHYVKRQPSYEKLLSLADSSSMDSDDLSTNRSDVIFHFSPIHGTLVQDYRANKKAESKYQRKSIERESSCDMACRTSPKHSENELNV